MRVQEATGRRISAASIAASNLLRDCAGLRPGDDVVICREDPCHGWYDADVAAIVADEAERMGIHVRRCEVGPPEGGQSDELADLLTSSANVIFFARIGDQGRFDGGTKGCRVMVYARNAADLASDFGCVPHGAMQGLKQALDHVLFTATEVEITCPHGTRIAGRAPRHKRTRSGPVADVTTRRFPLGVPAPVPAAGFSGRVALSLALTPTGNRTYEPAVLQLSSPVIAVVEAGRIAEFEGEADQVQRVRDHYGAVADQFGLDPFVVHSWHAGLHPGCRFFAPGGQDLDYWSNSVFSSPRLLHFHTCGTVAPGEISWNLIDATVRVDGVPLWDAGRLRPALFPRLAACLVSEPCLAELF